ncbi:hypothetical protein CEUSTIGMA_g4307.t1 [Chlamydomonas eustigma]|uniref:Uncharacterized protein n=1 Tax=Chlamydomonas eustigma TaxID=1157962 RepID=A0A250X1A5_9CHLO|nr:hypothetical protein CEUSTIGMA_g4307.t1 [Chlamydomonas eustigma]|eukprot:GAX76861.1 hypothetical protein CEUSTIGMA_g4307.t1 [Chlamydomonas eustigma]
MSICTPSPHRLSVCLLCTVLVTSLTVTAISAPFKSYGTGHHDNYQHRAAWAYKSHTPIHMLNRAQAYLGDTLRMNSFLQRMAQGETVTIAWQGSSVSLAGGSEHDDQIWVHQIHKWLEMTFSVCGDNATSHTLHQDSTEEYIRTGHTCTASNITLINLSVYASQLLFMEACKLYKVPRHVDLVVLEQAVSDEPYFLPMFKSPHRLALERMIRHLLTLPRHPAVLMVET